MKKEYDGIQNQDLEDEAHGIYAHYPYEKDLKELRKKLDSLGMKLGDKVGDNKYNSCECATIMDSILSNSYINFAGFALSIIEEFEEQENKSDLCLMYIKLKEVFAATRYDEPYIVDGTVTYLHTHTAILDSLYFQFREKLEQNEEKQEQNHTRRQKR